MHFTTFFTLLAVGYGAMAQTPTQPEISSSSAAVTDTPPKQPGVLLECEDSSFRRLDNAQGICGSAGGNFNTFSGCCIDSGSQASFTQGCSDNGGTARTLGDGVCDLAA